MVFFLLYVTTLIGNLLILFIITMDSCLHSPMYFFLGNLALLDICSSSITTPRMLSDLNTSNSMISLSACITQIYFFISFATSEVVLLAVMSYDRYVAVCYPLHYMQRMTWKACVQLALGVWLMGLLYSLLHTLFTLRLTFCDSKTIHSFFCDLSKLFQISCTDTFINTLIIFIFGGSLGSSCFIITFFPYISIFTTVLNNQVRVSRIKTLSTCTSHLTVVFIFYGTLLFNYFRPTSDYQLSEDKIVSVFYTVITPILNPIIYSLRNKEIKKALKRICKTCLA
ncbi:hypothetical protein XELAEV_18023897mg [Xenopus laevis]|nr:hypothetical protein XELAEV_18023897mg [Xenopus laevis]